MTLPGDYPEKHIHQTFSSSRELTRWVYIRDAAIITIVMIIVHFLSPLRHKSFSESASNYWVEAILYIILLAWILRRRTILAIILDPINRTCTIEYMTLFKSKQNLVIDYPSLNFTFIKRPSRSIGGRKTLTLNRGSSKVIELEVGQDGFSERIVDELVQELKFLQEKKSILNGL